MPHDGVMAFPIFLLLLFKLNRRDLRLFLLGRPSDKKASTTEGNDQSSRGRDEKASASTKPLSPRKCLV